MTTSTLIIVHVVAATSSCIRVVEVWTAASPSEIALVVITSAIGIVVVVSISIPHILLATTLVVIIVIVVVIHVTTTSTVLVHIVVVLVIVAARWYLLHSLCLLMLWNRLHKKYQRSDFPFQFL